MASPAPQAYPYRRLRPQFIRLLKLYPGSEHELIVCSLEEVHVSQLPAYEALSYCWGDAKDKVPVKCDGHQIGVTRNLHGSLARLRLRNQTRLLWADAMCINQEDKVERSAQVLLMQDIYRRATSVAIWLGGPVEVDGVELWSIPHLLEAAQKNLKRTQLPIRHGTQDWIKFVLSNDWTTNGDLQDKKWNAIIKSLIIMLQRPWFLRTWIIQEVALARYAVVLCGSHSASWDDFYRAVSYAIDVDYFSNTAPEMYSSIRRIENTRRDIMRQRYEQRPLDLLTNFGIFLATDPRDKVFGLYSLFSPSDLARIELKPNYDMDLGSVYTQAAVDCIASEGNLDVLSFAAGEDKVKAMPSWVPDWTKQDRARPLMPRFLRNRSFGDHVWPTTWQSATGNSYPVVELSEDMKVISLMGCIFDRVVKTGGVLEKDYFDAQPGHAILEVSSLMKKGYDVFRDWEKLCGVPENRRYFTGENALDVFWKTLHAGGLPYGDEEKTKTAFNEWYRPFKDITGLADFSENGLKHIEDSNYGTAWKVAAGIKWVGKLSYMGMKMGFGMRHTKEQTRMLGAHRTMIRTERGFVGLTSRYVQEGDYIAFFEGGKMPLILREATKDTWNLVSDAYIHGIMDGKLFETLPCIMLSIE